MEYKVWIEVEEIDHEADHYEKDADPVDVFVGDTEAEALAAKQLLIDAPTLAVKAADKLAEVAGALDGELMGLDCLSKYGEYCSNDSNANLDDAEDGTEGDQVCAVCAHADAWGGADEIITSLRELGALA